MNPTSRSLLGAAALLSLGGTCARPGVNNAPGAPASWPYPGITASVAVPPALQGVPLFLGRWMAPSVEGELAYLEASDPRFLIQLPYDDPRVLRFYDFGPRTAVENARFGPGGGRAVVVAIVTSQYSGIGVESRALLELDLNSNLLLDAFPLSRAAIARGFVFDGRRRVAYLLEDSGEGTGALIQFNLYSGNVSHSIDVGNVPAGVDRKGLVMDRNEELLFCLSGGLNVRHDFQPVDVQAEVRAPEVLILGADTLGVVGHIPLGALGEPRVLEYDPQSDRVAVLVSGESHSRVVVIDPRFLDVRAVLELPEYATDLTLVGGYGFAAGANGLYLVDLTLETLGRIPVSLGATGELSIAGDLSTALVQFESSVIGGGAPGVASVELQTGRVLDVLQ